MFNLLKWGLDGLDIWTEVELDETLTIKNEAFIDLQRVVGRDWKAWGVWLNDYYRDPQTGTIQVNHVFPFGNSNCPTIFKRQKYRDAAAKESDLHPTSRSNNICVGLTYHRGARRGSTSPPRLPQRSPPAWSIGREGK